MIVADAVSAMAMDRPYRSGLPPAVIVAELRAGAGTQVDASLVEPCVEVLGRLFPGRPAPQGTPSDKETRPGFGSEAISLAWWVIRRHCLERKHGHTHDPPTQRVPRTPAVRPYLATAVAGLDAS